ncbi:MAG TPA: hypothetical protein VNY80_12570 [Steroidobacteraceae bacterium]|jgi:hypothetical protein|nr:hypothetical protein [Steroidobacteraceae bacterium]
MRETLQELVATSVPPVWLNQIYRRIQNCYAEADAHVANYTLLGDPERRSLLPHLRRGLIEADARKWAVECGLQATIENTVPEGHQFMLIKTGQLCFTISKTATSCSLPDLCGFRKQHSRVNDMLMQQDFFPVSSVPTKGDELIYAILTHGPTQNGRDLDFVNLGFPNSEMTGWAEAPVSILEIQERQAILFQKAADDEPRQDFQEQQRTVPLKKGIKKNKQDDTGGGEAG